MTAADLILEAKTAYGEERIAGNNDLFSDDTLLAILNAKHKWLAALALCYYGTKTADVTANISAVALATDVIEADVHTVRVSSGGSPVVWSQLGRRHLRTLIGQYGPPEAVAAAIPTAYYLRAGAALNAARILELWPKPISSITGGLKYNAWLYPADLTTGDQPPLQPGEHVRLVPAICWGMAELEASRGREDAPVSYWHGRALADGMELAEIIRRGTREAPRTGPTAPTAAEDAAERRGSRSAGA